MIRTLVLALVCCWFASQAAAVTLEGATLPDRYSAEGQVLTINGIGLRAVTVLQIKAYVAGLYLAQPNHDTAQILASPTPKVLLMKFLRAVSKADVEKQFRAGEALNCGHGECDAADEAEFERLVAAAPAAESGDLFTYIFGRKGMRLLVNDQLVGDYPNTDLSRHFLAAFIGDHAASAQLRNQLLGLPGR
jgi:hypothetical protein